MPIFNVRHGFATNSSSSHSVVLAPGLSDRIENDFNYGWERFILASSEAKAKYLFVAAVNHYRRTYKLGEADASTLAAQHFPCQGWEGVNVDHAIDHQSDPCFPMPRVSKQGMAPLWKLLSDEVVNDAAVAILGGNDNDDNESWKPGTARAAPDLTVYYEVVKEEAYAGDRVFHCDETNGYFTVFDRQTGRKTRFGRRGTTAPVRASAPELVDIKITDYCPVGCHFCYQDSTIKGKHADVSEIENLIWYLRDCGVLEVAIGGGDPTTHPHFARILRSFREAGIVPNFSTQLWDWFDKPEILDAVQSCCGAVALSTQSPSQAKKWLETCNVHKIHGHIHYVLGLSPLSNLKKMLKVDPKVTNYTNYPSRYLVLLDFKQIGRASEITPINYDGWWDVIREHGDGWTIAVDSFLVPAVAANFPATEVSPLLYEQGDGRFSAYYDAVERTLARHSFEPELARVATAPSQFMRAWASISNG